MKIRVEGLACFGFGVPLSPKVVQTTFFLTVFTVVFSVVPSVPVVIFPDFASEAG